MKFRSRGPGRSISRSTSPSTREAGSNQRGPIGPKSSGLEWYPEKRRGSGGGGHPIWGRLISWCLILIGMVGIGANYLVPRFLPYKPSDNDICLARRILLARGALCLNPPPEVHETDFPGFLAYQDRIVDAELDLVKSVNIEEVRGALDKILPASAPPISYKMLAQEILRLAREEEGLDTTPAGLICPSDGTYEIGLYKLKEDKESADVPAKLHPGVTCSIHKGIVGGGKIENRGFLDRLAGHKEFENRTIDFLDRCWKFGILSTLVGLILLAVDLVRYRRYQT